MIAMKKYLFGLAALVLAACSTSDEVDNLPVTDPNAPEVEVFGAEVDEDTRAHLSGTRVFWDEGDLIQVWREGTTELFPYATQSQGTATRLIKQGDKGVVDVATSKYYGIYGNVSDLRINSGSSVQFTLPAEQVYRDFGEQQGTFGSGAHIMLAEAKSDEVGALKMLYFKNITSLIKVVVEMAKSDYTPIKELSLTLSGTPMTGEFEVTKKGESYEMTPLNNTSKTTTITITNIDKQINRLSEMPIYFAVPPGDYADPVLTMSDGNGNYYRLSKKGAFPVRPNQIVSLHNGTSVMFDPLKPMRKYELGQFYPSGNTVLPEKDDLGLIYAISEDGFSGEIMAGYLSATSIGPVFPKMQEDPMLRDEADRFLESYTEGGLDWRIPTLKDWRVYDQQRPKYYLFKEITKNDNGDEGFAGDYLYWAYETRSEGFEWQSAVRWLSGQGHLLEEEYSTRTPQMAHLNLVAPFPVGTSFEAEDPGQNTDPEPEPEPETPVSYEVGQWYPSGAVDPQKDDLGVVYYVSEDGKQISIIAGNAGSDGNKIWDGFGGALSSSQASVNGAYSYIAATYKAGGLTWRIPTLTDWENYNPNRRVGNWLRKFAVDDFEYFAGELINLGGDQIICNTVTWHYDYYSTMTIRNNSYTAYVDLVADIDLTAASNPEHNPNLRRYEVGQWYPGGNPSSGYPGSALGIVYEVSEDGLSGKIMAGNAVGDGTASDSGTFGMWPEVAYSYNYCSDLAASNKNDEGLTWKIPSYDEWETYAMVRDIESLWVFSRVGLKAWVRDLPSSSGGNQVIYWYGEGLSQYRIELPEDCVNGYLVVTADFKNTTHTVN